MSKIGFKISATPAVLANSAIMSTATAHCRWQDAVAGSISLATRGKENRRFGASLMSF